jgi:hypothetical protein
MIVTEKLTRPSYDLRVNYIRVRHDHRQGRANLHYCIVHVAITISRTDIGSTNFGQRVLPRVLKPSIYRDYRDYSHNARVSPDFCGMSVIKKLARFGNDIRVSYVRVRHDHRQGRASLYYCMLYYSRRYYDIAIRISQVRIFDSECSLEYLNHRYTVIIAFACI